MPPLINITLPITDRVVDEMTDLEITKLCAEAMGVEAHLVENSGLFIFTRGFGSVALAEKYDPLHDDAQAMALVKKLDLNIIKLDDEWWVHESPHICDYIATAEQHDVTDWGAYDKDLNRAICECVAKMGEAK